MLTLMLILKLCFTVFIACLFVSLFSIDTFLKYNMYGNGTKEMIKYRFQVATSFSIVPGINILITMWMFICALLIIVSKKRRETTRKNIQKKQENII